MDTEMDKEREKEKGQGCNHLDKTNTFLHLAAVPGTSHSYIPNGQPGLAKATTNASTIVANSWIL